MKLTSADIENDDFFIINKPDQFRETMKPADVRLSHDLPIMIRYDYIDLDKTDYNFSQKFQLKDTQSYFERMKKISSKTINNILDGSDRELHFHRSEIKGNLKRAIQSVIPQAIASNQIIYHFALYTDKDGADRECDLRSPRIYFMLGNYGHIYVLFFDPYHELNP
jgi:glutaredoxin-related protein